LKLQILSDLHLTVSALEWPLTDADVVILAGDIARPQQAIEWATGFGQPVFYVAGNHEFYGDNLSATRQALKDFSAGTPVQVLEGEQAVLDGVRFLGTTLWSDFKLFGEGEAQEWAIMQSLLFVRDFSRIYRDVANEHVFTPAAAMALFAEQVDWLQAKLNEPFAGPTVVITHHAPSRQSLHPRFAHSPISVCFVSDVEYLMSGERVALWVHGHTHDSFDYVVNGTRVICNPRGYARNGVNENAAFDSQLIVEVD
jgi:predicted phosphodiesterase